MDQQIIKLYDEYTHKPLSRHEFIRRLIQITGSVGAATTILPMIETNYTHAAITTTEDLYTEIISYPGSKSEMKAYIARPKKDLKFAAVMVIHENRGLNPHIEDVARRAANAGYMAIAPDA